MPWSQTISFVKAATTSFAVKGCFKGRKWPYFESRSTTTNTQSIPYDRGKPVMKSIEMSSQIAFGIARGYSKLAGLVA